MPADRPIRRAQERARHRGRSGQRPLCPAVLGLRKEARPGGVWQRLPGLPTPFLDAVGDEVAAWSPSVETTTDGALERAPGEAPEAPRSFLVPSSESVDEIHVANGDQICPKRPQWVVCDQDPATRYPASCDAYRCTVCGPRKAMTSAALAAWSIRHADRARFVTLTLAPEDWQQRRQKMRDLRRLLQRRGYEWECAWSTEKGSRTGMVHVHGLQHGSYVPGAVLNQVWGARTNIKAVETGGVARYVTKDALRVAGYTVKGSTAEAGEGYQDYLDFNGGRPMHWSRGFLHGLDKRAALGEMKAELSQGEVRTWHLEPIMQRG